MYLVHIYPLIRGTPLDVLTYFSRKDYPRGSIVDVPIRGSKVPAAVARSEPAERARAALRRAKHRTLNLPLQEPRTIFRPEFLDAVEDVALTSVGTPGAILHAMLPAPLLSGVSLPVFAATDAADHFE